jgi:hypothetical protein
VGVDLYESLWYSIDFLYPHMVAVCVLNFDDYSFPTSARARRVVGEALAAIGELPICPTKRQRLFVKPDSRGRRSPGQMIQ